jgi:N-methylhydantoinase B
VRTPEEREGDLTAQIGACRIGVARVTELVSKYGFERVQANVYHLLNHSQRLMSATLESLPEGVFEAEDYLDNDGITNEPVRLAVKITTDPARGRIAIDFTGSAPQVAGSLNAVSAITYSAVFYVLRCLLSEEAATTAGLMRPVDLCIPPGTVVNALPPSAVAAGNVETSQRIVDVLLRAFAKILPDQIPAASSGTMNNLTVGGMDARTGKAYAYYETIAGGTGGRPHSDGVSGIHTHMTNSLNTPVEALEYAYPFRVKRYSYRRDSGGAGKHRGGDGLIREVELLGRAQITLLAERRIGAPYGLQGGADGARGRSILIVNGEERELPGKCNLEVEAGAILRIETPGGGGWGHG